MILTTKQYETLAKSIDSEDMKMFSCPEKVDEALKRVLSSLNELNKATDVDSQEV